MNSSNGKHTPFVLAILDGLGLNPSSRGNAILEANTPTLDRLLATYPNSTLITHGERVGLPEGQMGNSEVGHMNIGAGRVVEQVLTRIDRVVRKDDFSECSPLIEVLDATKQNQGAAVHFIGLLSTGGVHSQQSHLLALIKEALRKDVEHVFVHAITDGRDRPREASIEELGQFEEGLEALRKEFPTQTLQIASVIGRYYAMDRDNRWERTSLAYNLFTLGEGEKFPDALSGIRARHAAGQTDEFIKPILIDFANCSRSSLLEDFDSVVFFNFRADRMKQLVPALTFDSETFKDFDRSKIVRFGQVASMTEYDKDFPVRVLFEPPVIKQHLGEVLASTGLRQLRIAETEKYPHVTYFFNGGVDTVFPGEERILVPSPRDVATYDQKPEMSASEITEQLLTVLENAQSDVVILNFANCDMVGHTGDFEAAKHAAETVDSCLEKILDCLDRKGGAALIIADHGNADQMVQYDTGEAHTYHTTHPVPCILYGEGLKNETLRDDGALEDVAPTILNVLNIDVPTEMSGASLLK